MKNFFLQCAVIALVLFTSCQEEPAKQMPYNEGINIIPAPKSLVQHEGAFILNKSTGFYAPAAEAKTIADFFAAKLNRSTGYSLKTTDQEGNNTISLLLDHALDLNQEGHTLEVNDRQVVVKANTPQGLFYGMQSFMQLLPAEVESPSKVNGIAWNAPAVSIQDEPRFGYRGIMFDICRHFMTVDEIKKQLDVLALFKINIMHWHLTDDQGWRIEIKKYPKLTEVGSRRIEGEGFEYGPFFYTQEEIKEVVQYAADRFITVIPEIEVPGHELAAIAAYPELSCTGEPTTPRIVWGVEDIVLCAGKDEVFDFFEDVIAEVVPLFPGEYFHIGGDECPKRSWEKCPLCQKRIREEGIKATKEHSAEEGLQSYFVQRIEKIVNKHGKKMIGWDEILEGGLAPTAIVMSWQGEQGGIAAASMGHDAIMTPGSNGMYLDQYEGDYKIDPVTIGGYTTIEKVYHYNPTPDTLVKSNKDNHILGVQCNIWAEYMYEHALREYKVYPRILALSEIGWTALDKKDYKDFERRLDNGLVRLDGHHINYYIPLPEQPFGSCDFVAFTDQVAVEFKTSRPMKMIYTLDGTEPTQQSAIYESPLTFTESGTIQIRSVLPSGKMSKVRTITVEKQTLAPAKEVAHVKPGLKMDIADGYFLESSQIKDITDWNSSIIKELIEIPTQGPVDWGISVREFRPYGAIATGYVHIPEDGVYYVSSDHEEVWIDGKLVINNRGEVKRFSRKDRSIALAQGMHEIKIVFLGHIIGGWPTIWSDGHVALRHESAEEFQKITGNMLFH